MSHRIRRATSVVAMFAASTAAVTLGATESASAASFSASVATNGSIGTMWVDAIYDGQGGLASSQRYVTICARDPVLHQFQAAAAIWLHLHATDGTILMRGLTRT